MEEANGGSGTRPDVRTRRRRSCRGVAGDGRGRDGGEEADRAPAWWRWRSCGHSWRRQGEVRGRTPAGQDAAPRRGSAAPGCELRARTADGRPETRRGARRSGARTRRFIGLRAAPAAGTAGFCRSFRRRTGAAPAAAPSDRAGPALPHRRGAVEECGRRGAEAPSVPAGRER